MKLPSSLCKTRPGLILAGLAGTLCGRLVLARLSDAGFQKLLNIALVLIALRLIWSGLRSL